MRRTKPVVTMILSGLVMATAVAGLYAALHSSLFTVRVVEVSDQPQDAPLDPKEVTSLAAVPLGKVSLISLDLENIQRRLFANHWVRNVVLTKRFPQTLSVQVIYREPVALLQGPQGVLKYVDSDGSLFGPVTLKGRSDLPLIHGLPQGAGGEKLLGQAMAALRAWSSHAWKTPNQISQLTWDEEEGFTAWIAFDPSYRISVILGPEWNPGDPTQAAVNTELFSRIDSVLRYSVSHSIPIRQIYADANKKIVVRTARRS
ncbi:MAG: FtsQ-type POTRA domain-containing protein [Bdellovibrionales bacterium]|nr:FtsQ-type POTRA domain-containing protein [Bdellovibrionales bacterium]